MAAYQDIRKNKRVIKRRRKREEVIPGNRCARRVKRSRVRITRRVGSTNQGTPRKLTLKARKIIYTAIEAGLPLYRCHDLIGVSKTRFNTWLEYGDDPQYPLYFFWKQKIKKIRKQREIDALNIINNAASGGWKQTISKIKETEKGLEREFTEKTMAPQWQAAAWFLERLYKDVYGRELIKMEKTPEEYAREIHDAAKQLFNSVPVNR